MVNVSLRDKEIWLIADNVKAMTPKCEAFWANEMRYLLNKLRKVKGLSTLTKRYVNEVWQELMKKV